MCQESAGARIWSGMSYMKADRIRVKVLKVRKLSKALWRL